MRCRIKSGKLKSEKGSVLLLVAMALTAIMGIVGLAMDTGQLYVTYQQAQAAADAAVLAGAMDMYNTSGFDTGAFLGGAISCVATSTQAPCAYARLNGFSPPDTVTIGFLGCPFPPGVPIQAVIQGAGNLICATVSRQVPTTFLRVLGTDMSTVTAKAWAAIIGGGSLTPILVTHPTLSGALSLNGGSSIVICGGPNFGIQVNSNSDTAFQSGGTVDLSKGGQADSGGCDNGTGSIFRVVGGPAAAPGVISLGTTGRYSSRVVSATVDQLASVNPPAQPAAAPATSTVASGVNGCQVAAPATTCTLYSPGTYPAGIAVSTNALFEPGIYYITAGGFQGLTGGCMAMATGFTDPLTGTGWTQNMLVYNTGGGTFSTSGTFGQGCAQKNLLQGSRADSQYEGILFFQDRNSPMLTHNFAGSGGFTLNGTIYMNSTNPAQYQTLNLTGGTVYVSIEITVGSLTLNNGGSLTMNVVPGQTSARQVALVQ